MLFNSQTVHSHHSYIINTNFFWIIGSWILATKFMLAALHSASVQLRSSVGGC